MGGNRNQLFKAVMLGVARQPGDPAVCGAPEGTCAAQPLAPDNRAVPPGSQVGSTPAPASQPAISVSGTSMMAAIDQNGGAGRGGSGAGIIAAAIGLASSQP